MGIESPQLGIPNLALPAWAQRFRVDVLAAPFGGFLTAGVWTVDLAAAIAAAAGGTLFFPAGTYRISSNVTIPANVGIDFAPGALLSIDAGKTFAINGPLIATLTQFISGAGVVTFGSRARAEVFPQWWGATGDGVTDDRAALQAALDVGGTVRLPRGTYALTTGALVQSQDFTTVQGSGRGVSTIVAATGYAFKNYAGLDTDTATGNIKIGLQLYDLTLRGGFVHTDVFAPPTNSWNLANGRGKALTTVGVNVGLRWKTMQNAVIERVELTGFHRGVDQRGAVENDFRNCTFGESQVGFYCTNGAEWGDVSFKCTTQRVTYNQFRNLWVGVQATDLVDQSVLSYNVYEPCNTGVWCLHGGDVQMLGEYWERCYEGFILDGGFAATYTMESPHFTGVPGNFWGGGKSIQILSTAGSNAIIHLMGVETFGGGGAQIDAGRLVIDRILPGISMTPKIEVRSLVNTALYPDPFLTRGGFMLDFGAGISSGVIGLDSDGDTRIIFTGTGAGLAFNGARILITPLVHDTPVKIRFKYRYTGTSVGLTAFGVHFAPPTNGFRGALNVSDTGGAYVQADVIATDTANFGNAFAHGGFDGTLEIKDIFISQGYAPAVNAVFDPRNGFYGDNIPTARTLSGPWKLADVVRFYNPVEAGAVASKYVQYGWICTVPGTPGTWLQQRTLTGN